jgi:anti-sigma regulatory factor (Ser/Thr protein kinase)
VGFVIGDVAGHGVDATSFMGQVRTSIRAYALEGLQPSAVVDKAHRFLRQLNGGDQMVTLLYVTIDLDTLEMRVVNAGHPPPIVTSPGEGARFLETRTALPLGIDFDIRPKETRSMLEPGTAILLYTDGLVDRRSLPIENGFAAIDALLTSEVSDDVAVLAVELSGLFGDLALSIDGDPRAVASVRTSLTRWLSSYDVERSQIDDVVLACSEACSNSVEHAYGLQGGSIESAGELIQGEVVVSVRDSGAWRPARGLGRGRGLKLIDACMAGYVVDRDHTGTVITMRRRVRTSDPG